MSKKLALQKLDQINSFRKIFNQSQFTLNDKDALLDYIDNALSPENLACDGEASFTHIKYEKAALMALRELVSPSPKPIPKKIGDTVSFRNESYKILKILRAFYVVENLSNKKQYKLRIGVEV